MMKRLQWWHIGVFLVVVLTVTMAFFEGRDGSRQRKREEIGRTEWAGKQCKALAIERGYTKYTLINLHPSREDPHCNIMTSAGNTLRIFLER